MVSFWFLFVFSFLFLVLKGIDFSAGHVCIYSRGRTTKWKQPLWFQPWFLKSVVRFLEFLAIRSISYFGDKLNSKHKQKMWRSAQGTLWPTTRGSGTKPGATWSSAASDVKRRRKCPSPRGPTPQTLRFSAQGICCCYYFFMFMFFECSASKLNLLVLLECFVLWLPMLCYYVSLHIIRYCCVACFASCFLLKENRSGSRGGCLSLFHDH